MTRIYHLYDCFIDRFNLVVHLDLNQLHPGESLDLYFTGAFLQSFKLVMPGKSNFLPSTFYAREREREREMYG